MNPMLLSIGGLGSTELFVLIGISFLYALPIWLSFRKYREGQSHWRTFSILGTILLSWIGYILVSSIHAGTGAYLEERLKRARSRE